MRSNIIEGRGQWEPTKGQEAGKGIKCRGRVHYHVHYIADTADYS